MVSWVGSFRLSNHIGGLAHIVGGFKGVSNVPLRTRSSEHDMPDSNQMVHQVCQAVSAHGAFFFGCRTVATGGLDDGAPGDLAYLSASTE